MSTINIKANLCTDFFQISIANNQDRESIYKLRHAIYAEELAQHKVNDSYLLKDGIDAHNIYIVAKRHNSVKGFISITPAQAPEFSIDKYFNRSQLPISFDEYLYEVRLLSISTNERNSSLSFLLMYAAWRWVSSHGGKNIIAICRKDIIELYRKAGLKQLGISVKSGAVTYELSMASVKNLEKIALQKTELLLSLQKKINWRLPFSFLKPSLCYHGGSFFKAIGEDLQTINKNETIINADVLDAWFPPSPTIIKALQDNLSWLLQTSPPTHCEGLIKTIADYRGVNENCILPGAGSSDLIFLALRHWLNPQSKVLILDPCYGEYIHVLEKIIQCQVNRHTLKRENGFVVDTDSLLYEINNDYDMIILVNPNSPTGLFISKEELKEMLIQTPDSTMVWIDETYIEYAGKSQSLEQFATERENIIVCKSMSKVYSLSGARVAYLCCSPHLIEKLKSLTPPWAVSLPAQLAAVTALRDEGYYQKKYLETHFLREALKDILFKLGIHEIIPGIANFLLFYLPNDYPDAEIIIEKCKAKNLFLRDVSEMGTMMGKRALRIAVKDEKTNKKMIGIIEQVLKECNVFINIPTNNE